MPLVVVAAGPNVNENVVCTTAWVPWSAAYVSFTVRVELEASGIPAALRIAHGCRRAQEVVASGCDGFPATYNE